MKAEQRAATLAVEGDTVLRAQITRAIRAAENARAESIAKWIDSLDVAQSKHAVKTLRALSSAIRAEFKSLPPANRRFKIGKPRRDGDTYTQTVRLVPPANRRKASGK